ncbi:type II toxin-antitoxin system RelE/ParE family toxin [Kitasatospora sp. McL0602]|uniref:type II toxin-antitoxin system RelE/ParE family toxin n=1 Tax=Kitasatospora sp. McL0602 TaxID=3439530 RepID=UPI003F8B77AD
MVYEQGAHHMIEAARMTDGRYPADEYLNSLLASNKPAELDRLANLLIRLEHYAHRGTLEIPRELNELRDGMWEFKAGRDRLPFFNLEESPSGALRLTHGFYKKQQETPHKEINMALKVRREDLES